MAIKKYQTRVPIEYQELNAISNTGTQYIDTGLKGSDLVDCEVEIVMRNNTTTTTRYMFNGSYLSGSTAQFGLVATSNSECRASINYGFTDAISVTGLSLSDYHIIYAKSGLQKVDNTTVGTLNFGTLNNGNFLLFARSEPNQASGVNICAAMSLKSFTVKKNNQYIRNMIPVKRKSDNELGLYDLANGAFYTNQGAGTFIAGSNVDNYVWNSIPYRKYGTETDTITSLPADLYADGNSATVGLVGNMSQTGTPTPQNPIQPSETGDKTANLCPMAFSHTGVVDDSGNTGTYPQRLFSALIPVDGNKAYSIKLIGESSEGEELRFNRIIFFDSSKTFISRGSQGAQTTFSAFTTPNNCAFISIDIRTSALTTPINESDITQIWMLEGTYTSSTMPSYQPYGYKIPISSANTTTNVYLGEVQSTRQIKKLVLTGQESITMYTISTGNLFRITLPQNRIHGQFALYGLCSHYRTVILGSDRVNGTISGGDATTVQNVVDIVDDYANETNFKTYLAQQYSNGTPVTVWYVLATPTTGIVNEPIRKIGDYADTVSGITIPTITGKDSFDVQTTLKPSEVSLSYTGWHDTSVKEKSRNLFDKDNTTIYNAYFDASGSWLLSNDSKSIKIPCQPNTEYTISVPNSLAVFRVYESNNASIEPSSTYPPRVTEITRGTNIGQYTFTTSSTAQIILFQGSNGAVTEWFNGLMLNTGSTALPYEPYWK